MVEIIDSIAAALSSGENPITAFRAAFGYTIDELAIVSGLSLSELSDLEAGVADHAQIARVASLLGLPDNLLS